MTRCYCGAILMRLPTVLSKAELQHVLANLTDPYQLMAKLM